MCAYYATFFFGVATASSVPLCAMDLCAAVGSAGLAEALKPPFALLFLGIRTAYWPLVSLRFWKDCLWALRQPAERVHSSASYAALLAANVGLTLLQFVWTKQIVAGVLEALA